MLKLFRIVYFPISVLLSTFITLILIIFRPFNPRNNSIFQTIFNSIAFPFFGIHFKIDGQEHFSTRPAVVIANHQHNFDLLMCSKALLPGMLTVGKKELAYIPIFGQAFWLGGNIILNRNDRQSALKSMSKLEKQLHQNNISVVIFPEGHRNKNKELLPFKKGAFYTAVHCQVPIICFSVSSYAQHLDLSQKLSCKMHIKVHPPISTTGLTEKDIPGLIEKTRALILNGREELDQKLGY